MSMNEAKMRVIGGILARTWVPQIWPDQSRLLLENCAARRRRDRRENHFSESVNLHCVVAKAASLCVFTLIRTVCKANLYAFLQRGQPKTARFQECQSQELA